MARRTFIDYQNQVLHALGNPDTADLDISPADLVNDALEHIAALHPWNWLSTGEQSLDVVGGQDFIELPADFGMLVAIEHDQGWSRQMIETTWKQLLRMRQDTIQDWTRSYFYVINTGNVTAGSEADGLGVPTINLYPTPADSQADAIKLVYLRFLRRLVDDTDTPQWPTYMDRLLSLLARGFATTDYDDNPDSAYTAEFRVLLADVITRDGLSQPNFGVMRGGLYPRTVPVSPFYPAEGIPDPVHITEP